MRAFAKLLDGLVYTRSRNAKLKLIADYLRATPDPVIALASGWMRVRQRAKQRGVELPLVISDHADWDELTQTLDDVNPEEVWVTHGREEAVVHHATTHGRKARALSLVGFEEDDGEGQDR
jgi:putative mRNA 3-end processing factor